MLSYSVVDWTPEEWEEYFDSKITENNGKIKFDLKLSKMDLTDISASLDNEYMPLLKHPLLEAFLYAKWKSIKWFYLLNLALNIIFLIVTILLLHEIRIKEESFFANRKREVFIFGYIVGILKVIYQVGCEVTQFLTSKKKIDYLKKSNALDLADIIATIVSLVTIWIDQCLAFNSLTWVVLLGFLNLTFSAGEFPLFGAIIQAIFGVSITLLSVMFVVTPILTGFIIFFYFTLPMEDKSLGVLSVFQMMLGNIDVKGFTNIKRPTDGSPTAALGSVEFGVMFFMIFICIVIMNVLIGLTVNRIDQFVKKGHLIRLQKTARALVSDKALETWFSCFNKNCKNTWSSLEVSKEAKCSISNSIMSLLMEVQCDDDNDIVKTMLDHEATLHIENSEDMKVHHVPSWVVQEAIKIVERRKKSNKKADQTEYHTKLLNNISVLKNHIITNRLRLPPTFIE